MAVHAAAPTCRRSSTGTLDGKINIDDLITRWLSLDRINDGYELMKRAESIWSVVIF